MPDPDAVDRVRFLKELLGLMVGAGFTGGQLPPGSEGWADMWERHTWDESEVFEVGNTPWDSFTSAEPAARGAADGPRRGQAPGEPEVFLLSPIRHWITSPTALEPFGWLAVVTSVPAEYLDAIPCGPDIN